MYNFWTFSIQKSVRLVASYGVSLGYISKPWHTLIFGTPYLPPEILNIIVT